MPSQYSDSDKKRAIQTLDSIVETINQIIAWNKDYKCVDDYYSSPTGMQLLAANCMLITAIGEGINRINRVLPEFLKVSFPEVHWHAIIGMRNHIAHGYFELDADLVFEAVRNDIPPLLDILYRAKKILN